MRFFLWVYFLLNSSLIINVSQFFLVGNREMFFLYKYIHNLLMCAFK